MGGLQEKLLAATLRVFGSPQEARQPHLTQCAYFSVQSAGREHLGEHPSTLSCGLCAEIPSYVGPHLSGSVHAAVLPWG